MKACLFLIVCSSWACQPQKTAPAQKVLKPDAEATSLLGRPLTSPIPSDALVARYQEHKAAYEDDPSADNLIWLGRFTAYQGQHREAIKIYSTGIKAFPRDARLYRHRGHRYITLRKFDKAIEDFLHAVELIRGKKDEIEPDGMPNARNIPVSTLHGNIWYHLGLSYYLKHDYQKAHHAYLKCRETASTPDNLVSSSHWLYMIARRIGEETLASEYINPITEDMDVIENMAYHNLCLFYQGEITEDELLSPSGADAPAGDAILYGLGNWHHYNGDRERSKEIYNEILQGKSWGSFGYIAAESDVVNFY